MERNNSKEIKFSKRMKLCLIIAGCLIVLPFLVRNIGRAVNRRVPDGGINEERYVEINGEKMWISIYGQDKDNPVLLYLHGGPGTVTSDMDWQILRKLSDVYTVVDWDQRNSGHSWSSRQDKVQIDAPMMMQDGKEMTEYLRDSFGKDKITLMGVSWGSIYGANLALEYPEYYDSFIGLSQVVDIGEMNRAFKEIALEWAADDSVMYEKAQKLADKSWAEIGAEQNIENMDLTDEILKKYSVLDSFTEADLSGMDLFSAKFFNPYWSVWDYLKNNFFSVMGVSQPTDYCYYSLMYGEKGIDSMSLLGRYDYEIPVYMVICDRDYNAVYSVSEDYFSKINAPDKAMNIVPGGHYNSMMHCDELSEFVHEIYEKNNNV